MRKLFFYILIATVVVVLASCSHKSPIVAGEIKLDITIRDIQGTQVVMDVIPENDMVYYGISGMTVQEYDRISAESSVKDYINDVVIKSYMEEYEEVVEWKKAAGHKYMMSPGDYLFSYAPLYGYRFIGLQPLTEYYAMCFCVDPSTYRIIGDVQKERFCTTAIMPTRSEMTIDFMIKDADDYFYFYSKPISEYGVISTDPYIVGIVSDDYLQEHYGGDVVAYAADYYLQAVKEGRVSSLLKTDISRTQCPEVHEPGHYGESKAYTILGCPYNINNIDKIFTLHFTYKPGMSTRYSHTIN